MIFAREPGQANLDTSQQQVAGGHMNQPCQTRQKVLPDFLKVIAAGHAHYREFQKNERNDQRYAEDKISGQVPFQQQDKLFQRPDDSDPVDQQKKDTDDESGEQEKRDKESRIPCGIENNSHQKDERVSTAVSFFPVPDRLEKTYSRNNDGRQEAEGHQLRMEQTGDKAV